MGLNQDPWHSVDVSGESVGAAGPYKGREATKKDFQDSKAGSSKTDIVSIFNRGYDATKDIVTATINDDARDLEAVMRFNPIINEIAKKSGIGRKDADPYSRSLLDNAGSVANTTLNVLGLIPGVQGLSAGAKLAKGANTVRKINKNINRVNNVIDHSRDVTKIAKRKNARIAQIEQNWQNQARAKNMAYHLERGDKLPFEKAINGPYKINPLKRVDPAKIAEAKKVPYIPVPKHNAWKSTMDFTKVQAARNITDHVLGGYKQALRAAKNSRWAAPTGVTHVGRTEDDKRRKKRR